MDDDNLKQLLEKRAFFIRQSPVAISHASDDRQQVEKLKSKFGGEVLANTKPNRRFGRWSWNVTGDAARETAMILLPLAEKTSPYMAVFLKKAVG